MLFEPVPIRAVMGGNVWALPGRARRFQPRCGALAFKSSQSIKEIVIPNSCWEATKSIAIEIRVEIVQDK